MVVVSQSYPNITALMPDSWSTHIGHGFRRSPQNLLHSGRDVGFLHFTGSGTGPSFFSDEGTDKFCHRGRGCNDAEDLVKFRESWGLAEHYVKLSWDWAFYHGGKSRLRPGSDGHALNYSRRDL